MNNWRAQWKKGITVFDEPKRSKVNKAFSSNKLSRLKFNSWNCVLLKFSLVVLLGNKNSLLTFDLLRLSKTVIPFSTGPSIAHSCHQGENEGVWTDSTIYSYGLFIVMNNCTVPRSQAYPVFTFYLWHLLVMEDGGKGVAGSLLVKADWKIQGSSPTCRRDLFLFWVHSTLPQKLSRRFSFASFGGDVKPLVPGNPFILAHILLELNFLVNWVIPGKP